jgi:hypothetical protein
MANDVRTEAVSASDGNRCHNFESGGLSCLFVLHITQYIVCLYIEFGVTTYVFFIVIMFLNWV